METELEQLKVELADAYAKQVNLELQLRNKDSAIEHKDKVVYRLKETIEHQRAVIEGLQETTRQLIAEKGNYRN